MTNQPDPTTVPAADDPAARVERTADAILAEHVLPLMHAPAAADARIRATLQQAAVGLLSLSAARVWATADEAAGLAAARAAALAPVAADPELARVDAPLILSRAVAARFARAADAALGNPDADNPAAPPTESVKPT